MTAARPLMRLRQGDSEREIARSGLMGRAGQGGPFPHAGPELD